MLFALALLRVADGIACSPGCPVVLPNGTHCGFRTGRECPRPFSVAEILESSRQWGVAHNAALNEQAHRTAAAACASTGDFKSLQSGGWCLRPDAHLKAGIIGHLPAKTEVVAALDALLKGDGTAPRFSLGDFGAGIGQYGHALKALDPRHTYRGFDGAGNIENVTERFVRFADLTLPVTLPVSDFVLSLEVGEHVPRASEASFVRNLDAHNRCGLIISWAALNQGGSSHINTHDPAYIRALLEEMGYEYDGTWSAILQRGLRAALRRDEPISIDAEAARDGFDAEQSAPCTSSLLHPPSTSFLPARGCTLLVLRKRHAPCSQDALDTAALAYTFRSSARHALPSAGRAVEVQAAEAELQTEASERGLLRGPTSGRRLIPRANE